MAQYPVSPEVPIGFHKAFRYFFLPVGVVCIIITFATMIVESSSYYGLFYSAAFGTDIVIPIIMAVEAIIGIIAFIGFFKWSAYSWYATIMLMIVGIISALYTCFGFATGGSNMLYRSLSIYAYFDSSQIAYYDLATIICTVIGIVIDLLVILYYAKRKNLFCGHPNMYQVLNDRFAQSAAQYQGAQPNGQYQGYQTQSQGQYQNPQATVPPQPQASTPYQNQTAAGNPSQTAAKPTPKFCSNCGAKLSNPNAKFCAKCGAQIK